MEPFPEFVEFEDGENGRRMVRTFVGMADRELFTRHCCDAWAKPSKQVYFPALLRVERTRKRTLPVMQILLLVVTAALLACSLTMTLQAHQMMAEIATLIDMNQSLRDELAKKNETVR